MEAEALLSRMEKILDAPGPKSLETALSAILQDFDCCLGTIHRLNPATGILELVTHIGMPDVVVDRVRYVPVGKGMAGLAAQRRECVSICNLQTDNSGDVRPGAKLTGMEGSIAVPMIEDGEVRGVLGVAKPSAYEFREDEKTLLLRLSAVLCKI